MASMQKVYFLGKLSGVSRKEAANIIRQSGKNVVNRLTADVNLIVVGDESLLSQDWNLWNDQLDADTRTAFEKGLLSIISETQFWNQYDNQTDEMSKTLYTPSMLAKLTGLSISAIRRLHQIGIITPDRQIFRLCYFAKESILPLKLTHDMLESGLSMSAAVSLMQKIVRRTPEQYSAIRIEGKDVLFVSGKDCIDQNGQNRFVYADDLEDLAVDGELTNKGQPVEMPNASAISTACPLAIIDSVFESESDTVSHNPAALCEAAGELAAIGNLRGAADLYRTALAAGGANPHINFQLAEVLYRQGERAAACERYYSAIELDAHFVEARASLGCLLAELGREDLAEAAFIGTLQILPDYTEVRYYLGTLLKRQGRNEEAEEHLRLVRESMPECME